MRFERLTEHHRLDAFTSGKKPIDNWLRIHAVDNEQRDLSRTYLLLDDGDVLVGYHSLAMGGVKPTHLPAAYVEASPAYERGMVLIARLAVDATAQGKGFGRDILVDAIERSAVAGSVAAAQFVAVDPIDEEARQFYAHFGFRNIEGDEDERMFIRLDEAIDGLR